MSQVGLCCWEQIGLRLDNEQSPYVSSLLFLCAPSVSSSFIPLTFSVQLYLPPHFVFPLSQASMEPCSVKSKWSILVGFKTDSLTTAFVMCDQVSWNTKTAWPDTNTASCDPMLLCYVMLDWEEMTYCAFKHPWSDTGVKYEIYVWCYTMVKIDHYCMFEAVLLLILTLCCEPRPTDADVKASHRGKNNLLWR